MSNMQMAAAVGLIAACAGCSSEAVPPADPPPLQTDLLDDLSFAIDGRDPLQEELVLSPETSYHVTASYTRRDDPESDWDVVKMLLVEDDTSERLAGIRMNRLLGTREDERPLADGTLSWECRLLDGTGGRNCTFSARPGRYELRLCWERRPASVAEMVAKGEDPLPFMTPFYRAYVTISPPDDE